MPPPTSSKVAPGPMILFGVLSVLTFVGPLVIIVVGRGGESTTWPPDRPIEWAVFLGASALYVAVLVATFVSASMALRHAERPQRAGNAGEAERGGEAGGLS